MQYLLLIYHNEKEFEARNEEARATMFQDYRTLVEDIVKTGNYKGGEKLKSTSTATTVRVRDGKMLATDGPFAETREQLGGFFLIEAKDLDEATAIAARIPSAVTGSIEVRPIDAR